MIRVVREIKSLVKLLLHYSGVTKLAVVLTDGLTARHVWSICLTAYTDKMSVRQQCGLRHDVSTGDETREA
jgi:hypothetical protein